VERGKKKAARERERGCRYEVKVEINDALDEPDSPRSSDSQSDEAYLPPGHALHDPKIESSIPSFGALNLELSREYYTLLEARCRQPHLYSSLITVESI
jgi:hypothetical protein